MPWNTMKDTPMFPPNFHPDTFHLTIDLQPPPIVPRLLSRVLRIQTAQDLEHVAKDIFKSGVVIDPNVHGITVPCQLALVGVLKFIQLIQAKYNAKGANGVRFLSPLLKSQLAGVLQGPAWRYGSCGTPPPALQILFKHTVHCLTAPSPLLR